MRIWITLVMMLMLVVPARGQQPTFKLAAPGVGETGIRVAISQQPLAVLKANAGKLRGVGIGAVEVCNLSKTETRGLDTGTIYAVIGGMHVSYVLPFEADLILDRAIATSPSILALDIGAGGSAVAGVVGVSGVKKMSDGWKLGLLAAPAVYVAWRTIIQKRVPSDDSTKAHLLRATGSKPDWILPPSACIPDGRAFLYRYAGELTPTETVIQ